MSHKKLTENTKHIFWSLARVGQTYSYSMAFMLDDIRKMAKEHGFVIKYIGSMDFTIVSSGVDINSIEDEEKPIKMIFTPTSIHFNIEITKDALLKILEKDKEFENERKWAYTLFNKLDRIDGVIDVNYDGHFGPNIHLRMDLDRSMRDIAEDVKQTIKEFLE
jgi:hypothetical protein